MIPVPRRALLFALILSSAISCRPSSGVPPKKPYVLVFLMTGPESGTKTPEKSGEIMAGHLANIGKLADEGKLLIAGPFAKPVPDDKLRGIFILDTPDVETALAWTSTDPGVKSGVFAVELAPFRTDAPLKRAVELYRAETAELEKSGKSPAMGERVRSYAMILAPDGVRAERAVAAAHAEDKVIFEGEVRGSPRGSFLAVLDVRDVGEAAELLRAGSVGDRDLVGWWAGKSLAGLAHEAH